MYVGYRVGKRAGRNSVYGVCRYCVGKRAGRNSVYNVYRRAGQCLQGTAMECRVLVCMLGVTCMEGGKGCACPLLHPSYVQLGRPGEWECFALVISAGSKECCLDFWKAVMKAPWLLFIVPMD